MDYTFEGTIDLTNLIINGQAVPITLKIGDVEVASVAAKMSGRVVPVPQWTPASVSGLKLWLKADAIEGLDDGDPVSSWVDSSGVSGNAEQATGSKQPSYQTNEKNSLPVVRFDGGDGLAVASVNLSTFCIWTVFKASGTDGLVYEHNTNSGSSDGCYLYTATGETVNVRRTTRTAKNKGVGTWGADGTWRICRHSYGGSHATHLLAINNSNQTLTDAVSNDPGSGEVTAEFNIACRDESSVFLTGDIAEILVYEGVPSAGDIALIETHLNDKYAVY